MHQPRPSPWPKRFGGTRRDPLNYPIRIADPQRVEIALKMAWQFWQQADDGAHDRRRTFFITLGNAYHGDTIGAVSLGGIDIFHARYGGLLFDIVQALLPCAYRHAEHISREKTLRKRQFKLWNPLIEEHAERLAAVVIEPGMQGAAGILTQPGRVSSASARGRRPSRSAAHSR